MVDVNYEKAQDFETWQVARATTAAPFYFEPLKIRSDRTDNYLEFTDGGFGQTNNPVRDARQEIESRYGDDKIVVLVSVGTARGVQERKKTFWNIMPRFTRDMASVATDPEVNHRTLEQELERYEDKEFSYYRLNNPGSLDIELDEWEPKPKPKNLATAKPAEKRQLRKLRTRFRNGLHKVMSTKCSKMRSRARCSQKKRMKTVKWERYATGAQYDCRVQACFETFLDQSQFREHLRRDHEWNNDKIKKSLPSCRKYWRYQART